MKIRQFRVGRDNFSYLVICDRTKKAVMIDPGYNASEAMAYIGRENLELSYVIGTHHHHDHVAENMRVLDTYGCELIASEVDSHQIEGVTRTVADGEVMVMGDLKLVFILTPGHTPGSMCIFVNGTALFTGDTMFIGDCGRTDLQGGSNSQMFESLQRLKSLPDDVVVYPGHDYGGKPTDTLGNQKRKNKVLLSESLDSFAEIP